MNAPPCPRPDELARDPNLCPICGHWCGKTCERRWVRSPVSELRSLVGEFLQERGIPFHLPLDREAFDAWLTVRKARMAQALSILENLERVPGLCAKRGPDGKWLAWLPGKAPHHGESLTEALGQLTTCIAIDGADA